MARATLAVLGRTRAGAGLSVPSLAVGARGSTERLGRLLERAVFQHVRVRRETRSATFESFGAYWAPIEAGTGQMPQAYLSLPCSARREVRDEVRTRLAEFESGGRFVMTVEMLIGAGCA
jgi:hypothetical protein